MNILKKIALYVSIFMLTIGALVLKDEFFPKVVEVESKDKNNNDVTQLQKPSLAQKDFKSEIKHLEGMTITSEDLRDLSASCNGQVDTKCLPITEFMKFCQNVDDISNATFKSFKYPYAFPSIDVAYLLENDGYKGFKIYATEENYRKDNQKRPLCRVEISVSGIYKGSQVSKKLESFVTSFVINKGEILVLNAKENSPYSY
jgi:hypothetical protein